MHYHGGHLTTQQHYRDRFCSPCQCCHSELASIRAQTGHNKVCYAEGWATAKATVWWPKIFADIKRLVETCHFCQENKCTQHKESQKYVCIEANTCYQTIAPPAPAYYSSRPGHWGPHLQDMAFLTRKLAITILNTQAKPAKTFIDIMTLCMSCPVLLLSTGNGHAERAV